MTAMLSLGLDMSATASGIVLLRENGTAIPDLILEMEIKPKSTGMVRAREVVLETMELIHVNNPDRIVVEGYSLGKNASSTIPLVEIGGILRLMMHLDGIGWYDPRASELKKFVSGKGNTPKSHMMMHVLHRWGHKSISDNTADGYGLACMGLAHANRLPGITKEMRAIVGNMTRRSQ